MRLTNPEIGGKQVRHGRNSPDRMHLTENLILFTNVFKKVTNLYLDDDCIHQSTIGQSIRGVMCSRQYLFKFNLYEYTYYILDQFEKKRKNTSK